MFMPFGTATLISYTSNTSAYNKGSKNASRGKMTDITKSSQQSHSRVTTSSQQSHGKVTTSSQERVTSSSSQQKVTTSSHQSQSKVTTSSQQGLNHTTTSTASQKEEAEGVSSFIEEGIREIQKLTAEASGSSTVEGTMHSQQQQQSQVEATFGTRDSSSCNFGAVDVEMRGSLGVQGRYLVLS